MGIRKDVGRGGKEREVNVIIIDEDSMGYTDFVIIHVSV